MVGGFLNNNNINPNKYYYFVACFNVVNTTQYFTRCTTFSENPLDLGIVQNVDFYPPHNVIGVLSSGFTGIITDSGAALDPFSGTVYSMTSPPPFDIAGYSTQVIGLDYNGYFLNYNPSLNKLYQVKLSGSPSTWVFSH